MRMSTVSRCSSVMLTRIAESMRALQCGWILRLSGVEVGIVKLSRIAGKWVAWTDDYKMVVVNSGYCCRKFDSSALAACGGVECCGCSVCS